MSLKSIRQFAEDMFLWVQGFFLWLALLLTLLGLLLVLWVGDCVKGVFAAGSDTR